MPQCKHDLKRRAQQQQGTLQKLGARVNSFSVILVSSLLSTFYLCPAGRSQNVNSEHTVSDITTVGKETNAEWLAYQPSRGRYTCSHLFYSTLLNTKDFKETGRFTNTFLHSIKAPKAGAAKQSLVFTVKHWECFRYMISREAVQPKNQLQDTFKVFWPGQQLLYGKQKFTKTALQTK